MAQLGAPFYLFLASNTLSALAMHCVRFAVSWLAASQTGSAVVFAAMIAISGFAEVYSKPVLAPLADYFNRTRVFRTCGGLGSAIAALILLAVVCAPFSAPLLTFLLVAQALVAALREPTVAALVPSVVAPKNLAQAQATRAMASSLVGLVGSVLGGVLAATAGVNGTLMVAASIAVAAFALMRLANPSLTAELDAPEKCISVYLRTWHLRTVDGLRATWAVKAERITGISTALINAVVFPLIAVVMPLLVRASPDGTAAHLAIIEAAFAVGVLVGSIWVTKRINHVIGSYRSMVAGPAIAACCVLAATAYLTPMLLAPAMFLAGIGIACYGVNTNTLRAVACPPAYRARLSAGAGFLATAAYPFASHFMGVLIESFGIAHAVGTCAAILFAAALLQLGNRDAKALMSKPAADLASSYQSLYPYAFVNREPQ